MKNSTAKKSTGFRKPMARKQGVKFLFYGVDTTGKTVAALSFPKIAFVDTESKVGVYENHPEYGKNLVGVADTTAYFDVLSLAEEVIAHPDQFFTFTTDSETNLFDGVKVAVMEVEEDKARKANRDVDDAMVGMRGWGKIGLSTARWKNIKVEMSAKGITVISIAHEKELRDKEGNVIGFEPELKRGAKHDFDVILRFTSKAGKFKGTVEKDTTGVHKIGEVIENPSYNNWKTYIEGQANLPVVEADYAGAIQHNKDDIEQTDSEEERLNELKTSVNNVWNSASPEQRESLKTLFKKHDPEKANPNRLKNVSTLEEILSSAKEIVE